VSLGSDSANSCGSHDLTEQGLLAVLTAREKTAERSLAAEAALEMMTRNGASAVGLGDELGSLEVGKRADLVLHRVDLPEAHPGIDRVRQLVFSQRARSVDTVVVNGQVIVEGGRPTKLDPEDVYAQARAASRSIAERIVERDDLAVRRRWPRVP
jgi:cytosine/adenosine deaminase-related metal-dependent hydrolase